MSGLRRIAEDWGNSVRGGNTRDGIEVSGNFRGVGWMERILEKTVEGVVDVDKGFFL